ncbi:TetR/AcrR family transcriptional regulator [Blastococcus jejuensis]|uniref:TetR/AcrR family transcriptional regulator n=1 Tax=Blastococcus jejuensis TaxID=351224 RepID=UPI0031E3C359
MSRVTGLDGGRSPRWETTHRRIYTAAMRLFQEHGFERVNIAQLAAAAEVSVPTFYAHFPSKEHVVMQLPTAEQMTQLLATQPAHLPVAVRLRQAAPDYFASWSPELRADMLARWKIIAATPSLRTRAAEFERATAGMVAEALPAPPGAGLTPGDAVVVMAHLAAFTSGLLAWADGDGERKVEELVAEAFEALQTP